MNSKALQIKAHCTVEAQPSSQHECCAVCTMVITSWILALNPIDVYVYLAKIHYG